MRAVKVQYPDIDKAIVNDLKSISLLESMIAPIGRKYHSKETLEEIKAVFLAELDYGLEAENAETFRRIHEGDDEIVIPRVWNAFSTRRVLTLEMVGGEDYAILPDRRRRRSATPQAPRSGASMFQSLFKHGVLYADPHPGNYRFLGGGRVAFLDYGCVKKDAAASTLAGTKRYISTAMDQDWEAFERLHRGARL